MAGSNRSKGCVCLSTARASTLVQLPKIVTEETLNKPLDDEMRAKIQASAAAVVARLNQARAGSGRLCSRVPLWPSHSFCCPVGRSCQSCTLQLICIPAIKLAGVPQ